MKLIVGLGNPGKEYQKTRHNIGFMVVDNYLKENNLELNKTKFNGKYTETNIKSEKVIFLEPQKYMNLSGEVIRDFVNFYKIDVKDILIISDDLDMKCGKIRLREKGSSGGHNGLKNIELHLNTNEYKRLKIGVGNNKMIETKDYVLGKFSKEDFEKVENSIKLTKDIIEDFIDNDFISLMSKYN